MANAVTGDETITARHGQVLSAGIYQLLLQRRMLDVTITCGGEAIMAHKCILVAYSKFLDTVFSGQGDDCDVLNMDNLGLEFEAIRAVIFFMYKGAIDYDRCGAEAFHNAAKILAVDTSTQMVKPDPKTEPPPPPPPPLPSTSKTPAKHPLQALKMLQRERDLKTEYKDQITMTDIPRVMKLTRFTQTDEQLTGLPTNEAKPRKYEKYVMRFSKETQATSQMVDNQSQTIPDFIKDLGLKDNSTTSSVLERSTASPQRTEAKRKRDESEDEDDSMPMEDPADVVWSKIEVDESATSKSSTPKSNTSATSTGSARPTRSSLLRAKLVEESPAVQKSKQKPEVTKPGEKTPPDSSPAAQEDVKDAVKTRAKAAAAAHKVAETPKAETPNTRRGRGRPRKYAKTEEESPGSGASTPAPSTPAPSTPAPSTPTPSTSAPSTPVPSTSAASVAKKTPAAKQAASDTPPGDIETPSKRGRGRPKKVKADGDQDFTPKTAVKVKMEKLDSGGEDEQDEEVTEDDDTPSKRGRGRPRKIKIKTDSDFDWMGTPKLRRSTPEKPRIRGPSDLHNEPKKHMWRKDGDGYHCLVCDWTRPTSKSLLLHLRIHLDERPYICETCGKGFRTADKLKDHNRTHNGDRPYSCDFCKRMFKTGKALIRHQLVHSEDKYHKCDQCEKAFHTKERLGVHVAHMHDNLKKYGCSVTRCDFRASEKKTILYHEAEKHGHPLPANLVTVCDVCGMSVRNSSIRMHMLIHAAKNLTCRECGFKTQYKNTLNGHMQRLHGINFDGTVALKPHKCSQCDEGFFSRQQLKFHELRHKGSKPHKCPICNFATVDKGSMNMHIRTHTGATPYQCSNCPKAFKQSSALSWHIKTVHNGLRKFRCEECDREYVNKKDLRAHRFSVHLKIKPFTCSNCSYCCTKKEYLAQHIERAHGHHMVPKNLLPSRTFKRKADRMEMVDGKLVYLEPRYEPDDEETEQQPSEFNEIVESVLDKAADDASGDEGDHPVVIVPRSTLDELTGIAPEEEQKIVYTATDETEQEHQTLEVVYAQVEDGEEPSQQVTYITADGSQVIYDTTSATDSATEVIYAATADDVETMKTEDDKKLIYEADQEVVGDDQLEQIVVQEAETGEQPQVKYEIHIEGTDVKYEIEATDMEGAQWGDGTVVTME